MGLYQFSGGVLTPIAGKGKAEYGASTVRSGQVVNDIAIPPQASRQVRVTFTSPMPDTNYVVETVLDHSSVGACITVVDKTANGCGILMTRTGSTEAAAETIIVNYIAYKLYTDIEYNNILAAMPSGAGSSNKLVTASDVAPIDVTQDFINHCTLNTAYYPGLTWNGVGTATWIRKCGHVMEAKFNLSIPSASSAKDLVPTNANTIKELFTFTKYKPAFTDSKACMVSGYTIGAGTAYQDGLVFCMEKEGSVSCWKSAMFPADANITYFWPDTMMWFTND